jgi:hypothetical protein
MVAEDCFLAQSAPFSSIFPLVYTVYEPTLLLLNIRMDSCIIMWDDVVESGTLTPMRLLTIIFDRKLASAIG